MALSKFFNPSTLAQLFAILLGALAASVGLKCFLVPNKLIDGGVMGVALLMHELLKLSLPLLIIILNLPLLFFARNTPLMLKGVFGIFCLSAFTQFLPTPTFTGELILAALTGGVLLGIGIGLAIRNLGVLDGSEVLAIAFNQKFGMSVGKTILYINCFIFFISSFFLPIEHVLFSIITYISASRVVDFVVYGLEEMAGVLIFSSHYQDIKSRLLHEGAVGVSILNGQSGISEASHSVLYCVVNRIDLHKVQNIVQQEDAQAFYVVQPVTHVQGGFIRRVFSA